MAYISVQDIRDEGVSLKDFPNKWIQDRITLAQNSIEQILKCFYEVRQNYVLKVDGKGYDTIDLSIPPARPISPATDFNISIEVDGVVYESASYEVVLDEFPDGRHYPKVLLLSGIWPKGKRNIKLIGDFGFVDIVNSTYQTPVLIKDLCKRITEYNMPKISDQEGQRSKRLISESLNKYRYTLSEAGKKGFFGDPDIDRLLGMYNKSLITTF